MEALEHDEMARVNGLLIGITGLLYTCSVNRNSAVYIELINNEWVAWSETYESHKRNKYIKSKTIASGSTFEYVLSKLKRYLENIKKNAFALKR
ncbi:hypothetical protein CD33_02425 [Ureibacillus sinduriensis BLB-1 = JCM 15800]|uniref:Pathogenicity island protein n=2 Tax=Ureibacillus sinduriensis TaxID=561440 RepID=A0A0A3HZ12_9BACL|nr:hypothetical protein CD33_02425 [Ureibacillus sinduriensis BLB-1 = JCM 15800]